MSRQKTQKMTLHLEMQKMDLERFDAIRKVQGFTTRRQAFRQLIQFVLAAGFIPKGVRKADVIEE